MATPLCRLSDVKVELNQPAEGVDDPLLLRLMGVAADSLASVTGWTGGFGRVTGTAEVHRAPNVTIGRDGALRVRLATPRITAVTALAYKTGSPAAGWTAVDLSLVDYESSRTSGLVRAYAGLCRVRPPLWAQVSYVAGWLCDFDATLPTDLPPEDLQELAIWWTGYLYRTKDAPFEKTSNPMTGTVTIPSAMPARLQRAVARWQNPAAA